MSNANQTAFDDLYRASTHILKQQKFSTELLNFSNRQQKIEVDIDEALFAYEQVFENAPAASHMLNFINKGIQSIKDSIKRNHTLFSMTANSIHQLREMMLQNEIHVPSWMPETFRLVNNNPQFAHNYIYYFDWSTVGVNLVSKTDRNTIEVIIKRLSMSAPAAQKDSVKSTVSQAGTLSSDPVLTHMQTQLKQAAASPDAPKVLPLNAPAPQAKPVAAAAPAPAPAQPVTTVVSAPATTVATPIVPVTLSAGETQLPGRVKLSLLAARQYLELYAKSLAEAVPFTLSIDDLTELLRTKECHFTQQALTMELGESGQISDSHVAIARLNNSKGFVTGNLVACSHKALLLKGELDASAFEQMMSALKTLMNSGLNQQQIQMMMSMQSNLASSN